MVKQTFNIEFSHIYADKFLSQTQLDSLALLRDLKQDMTSPYTTIVLIDDYNVEEVSLDFNKFLDSLNKKGARPDFWAAEKDLTKFAEELFDVIEDKSLKKSYRGYYQKKGKYPCSFLTAVWYLLRLGVFKDYSIIKSVSGMKFEPADGIINLLSDDFKEVEAITLKLLQGTKHKEVVNKIQNIFYESKAEESPLLRQKSNIIV